LDWNACTAVLHDIKKWMYNAELWIAFFRTYLFWQTVTDWLIECQFVLEHSMRITSMNSEFEERSKKMKNEFEKTLKEKNQVLI